MVTLLIDVFARRDNLHNASRGGLFEPQRLARAFVRNVNDIIPVGRNRRVDGLDAAQGETYEGYERTIDVHIKNLRQKLGDEPRDPTYILTVYGVGYKFSDKVTG